MDKKTTLNDLTDFYNHEKEYLDSIFLDTCTVLEKQMVRKSTIKNIKAYSKVLSIKHTKSIGKIDLILN